MSCNCVFPGLTILYAQVGKLVFICCDIFFFSSNLLGASVTRCSFCLFKLYIQTYIPFEPYRNLVVWQTNEGLRKALSKTDVAVGGADVAMKAAITPSEICDRMFCTEQVNNADFPDHFLKHPSRTVVINGLPDNLSFNHLKCALSTWGRITSVVMGASVSTVFVEFEVMFVSLLINLFYQ